MDLAYNYFLFSSVFNAIVFTFLSVLVLFKDRKNKINQLLSLVCLALALWAWPYIGWPLSKTAVGTLFWFQVLHIGACFIPVFYLHFVVTWLDLNDRKNKIIIKLGYIFSTFFAFLTFSPLFIKDMVPKFSMRFWAEPGVLYHFYLVVFFGLLLYSYYILFRSLSKVIGTKRQQVKLILIGMIITIVGGSTNYLLWYNINIPPYGNIFASSFVILTAYAVIRYNLLDIKLIVTEAALLIMNLILIFRFVISKTLTEFLINSIVLAGIFILSFILVRSVKKEIKRREEVTKLAHSLEKANLKLKELDRQKTEFLSIASHQLRTPLSIMKGYIELIEDGAYGKPTSGIVKTLDDMDESNERLVKLIDEFLDVTRIEQGRTKFEFNKHDINKLITSVVKQLREKAVDKGLKVIWKPNQKIKNIYMDDEKVRHVIFNFIDNATKYSNGGKNILVSLKKEKDCIVVRVKDEGIGFNKEDGINFFQKFYRGINVKGTNVNGTGLGLYVCRHFIEAHHGQVWSRSAGLGKGSEFGFQIPPKERMGCKKE